MTTENTKPRYAVCLDFNEVPTDDQMRRATEHARADLAAAPTTPKKPRPALYVAGLVLAAVIGHFVARIIGI